MKLMKPVLLSLLAGAAAAALSSAPAEAQEPRLVLSGVGRFAVFVDLSTREMSGSQVRVRTLQVAETGFEVEGQPFWGGWSWWAFDCEARTADRLDFASVLTDGVEGPSVPEDQPPFPVSPGGDAEEMLTVACTGTAPEGPVLGSVEAAVEEGHRRILM